MKRILVAIILLLTALFISTCSDSDDDNDANNTAIIYPLEVGSSWTYRVTWTEVDVETSTVDTVSYYAYLSADSLVQAPDGTMTTCLNSWSDLERETERSSYVANTDDGLRLLGTEGAGGFVIVFAAPKQLLQNRGIVLPGDYGDLEWYVDLPDSNANLLLPNPAVEGFSWTYQPNTYNWLATEHEIIGKETIGTAIGNQYCIHKHIVLPTEDDDETDDFEYDYYYSSKGIVYCYFDFGENDVYDENGIWQTNYISWIKYELVEYTAGR